MEGLPEMASSSFPASQMNNGSMANQADESQNFQLIYSPSLESGVGMNFQPTVHESFNQGYQVQSNIQRFHHTSQPHMNETRQNQTLIHHSNSQHTGQFQSNVAGQSQTDLTNSVQSDSLVHPQPTSQPQLNHGDPSQDSQRKISRRSKAANEAERRERIRESHWKYHSKMRQQQIDIYAEIENLKRKNANLAAQKKSLSDMIIQQPNVQIPAHIRPLLDCGQQPNEQIPAQIGQLVTPQIQHPSFSAPVAGFPRVSTLRMERNSLVAVARQLQQKSTSFQQLHELFEQQPNGSQFSNDVHDPQWKNSSSNGGGIASSSNPTEKQNNYHALEAGILKRIGEKRESDVTESDFPGLDIDRRVKVGKYNFPVSPQSTVEKITQSHGDVTKNSKTLLKMREIAYTLFCATTKEMDDIKVPEVTENCIMKWSDTINAALGIDFDVGFAMDHLKDKIVPAFVGKILCQQVDEMKEKISILEASLNALKQDHAKECEQSKVYKDAMDKFNGKSVSSGLFM